MRGKMLRILYEDNQILVVIKPAGLESQAVHSFEPDMVSEIKKHINKLSTSKKEPYVGVVHRLDKPVGGIMVYAKTREAAGILSKQIQNGSIKKRYKAVICGKLVDNVGNFVDYLLKNGKTNCSQIVDKTVPGAKRAELNYKQLETIEEDGVLISLVEIDLVTGRHHQIRVQFAGHGCPLWGDSKYNPQFQMSTKSSLKKTGMALSCCELIFMHPKTGNQMEFTMNPENAVFKKFKYFA